MSKEDKKAVRTAFRDACYKRDKYCCVTCGFKSSFDKAQEQLDAHHIQERKSIVNGGYVKKNGISLCAECHIKAEMFYSTGKALPGFSPDDLYKLIGSSLTLAEEASRRLK